MRSSFGRVFIVAMILLLVILFLIGISFQFLVRDVISKRSQAELKDDCTTMCELFSAYYSDGNISTQDFFVNLSLATQKGHRNRGSDDLCCRR